MSLSLPPSEAVPHIEKESAGYIAGRSHHQRAARVRRIWDRIRGEIDHYRAPHHHPVSSPKLVNSSKIKRSWSELHIDDKPGRHIVYMDTLCLAFRRASIQCRLEVKQPSLKRSFAEVTIKIGNKADQRIEEAIPVDLEMLRTKGFQKALSNGIEQEIKSIEKKKGVTAAKKAQKKYDKFKERLEVALQETSGGELSSLIPYALVHLHRSTIETEYSPCDHLDTVLEVKTDECEFETALGDIGRFAQIEFEHVEGDETFFRRELDYLLADLSLGIEQTNDSKEDQGMRLMEKVLLVQNNTEEEAQRIARNREILSNHLGLEFSVVNARSLGIRKKPCVPVVPAAIPVAKVA